MDQTTLATISGLVGLVVAVVSLVTAALAARSKNRSTDVATITELQENYAKATKQLTDALNRIVSLEQTNATQANTNQLLQAKIATLEIDNSNLHEQLAAVLEENGTLKAVVKENAELKGEIAELRIARKRDQERIAELTKRVEGIEKRDTGELGKPGAT